MKRTLLVIFLMVVSCGFTQAQTAEDSIRQVFQTCERALLDNDAEAVVMLVDTMTLNYYFNIAQQAMYAEKQEMQGLLLVDRISILSIRSVSEFKDLEKLDREEVFVWLFF